MSQYIFDNQSFFLCLSWVEKWKLYFAVCDHMRLDVSEPIDSGSEQLQRLHVFYGFQLLCCPAAPFILYSFIFFLPTP